MQYKFIDLSKSDFIAIEFLIKQIFNIFPFQFLNYAFYEFRPNLKEEIKVIKRYKRTF